jgi:tetratricopeptide (TPR) repeat protein
LLLANKLAAAGNTKDAATLYEQLRQSANMALRHEAAFQLAGIFMFEGRYREAALLYLDILNQAPNLPRVRLELARAYFMNKDYEDAQLQFELVKGGGLPPEVLDKVDHFLALSRRRKDWAFNFNLALVPDTNLNQASGGNEECISFSGALLCRPLEEKQSGVSLGGTFNHYWRFGRDFGLRSTIGLNILEHERSDFDDYQLYLASGPRYTFDSGEASLQPTFRKRWYAGK